MEAKTNKIPSKRYFYEQMYEEGREAPVSSGFLWKVFLRLRRFELHRRDAVFCLLDNGQKLLDLGCGCGSLMVLAKKEKFYEVHGIDISGNVITRAKKNLKREFGNLSKVHFRITDVDKGIPYPDSFFDTVTSVALLEHVFDPHFIVREVRRVLKVGGSFILEVPNIAWLPYRFAILFGQLPQTACEMGWDGGHLHYFTFKTVEKLMEANDFEVINKTTSGVFANIRKIYPSLLGANIIIKAKK